MLLCVCVCGGGGGGEWGREVWAGFFEVRGEARRPRCRERGGDSGEGGRKGWRRLVCCNSLEGVVKAVAQSWGDCRQHCRSNPPTHQAKQYTQCCLPHSPLLHAPPSCRQHRGCCWCSVHWRAWHADDSQDVPLCGRGQHERDAGRAPHQGDHQWGAQHQHADHEGEAAAAAAAQQRWQQ